MKLIILVLSYDDNGIYTKFYKSQMETWDSVNIGNVSTYYYFGNHECDEMCGNKILTSISESFENCGHKLLNSLELIKDLDYDFIFRTNSSSYVDKSILYDNLSKIKDLNYYAGINGNFRNVSYASGSGFVMTKNLVNLILENKSNFEHDLIDDVAVGKLVGDLGVPLYSTERFDINNNNHIAKNHYHYRIKTNNRENDISTMYKIHEIKTK
jgi:hypothetical protein